MYVHSAFIYEGILHIMEIFNTNKPKCVCSSRTEIKITAQKNLYILF